MITLDQITLLEQKIESAVAKIQQLQAENDALRSKCNELTNALSAKSEQLTSFESDQSQIEIGIKKALDRLNAIENSVLKAEAVKSTVKTSIVKTSIDQATPQIQNTVPQKEQPVQVVITTPTPEEPEPAVQQESQPTFEEFAPSFDTMQNLGSEFQNDIADIPNEEPYESEEDDNQDGLGFDIF